jgi:hypothetical protein
MMLEELQRRNYAPNMINAYLRSAEHFSKRFKRSPDERPPERALLVGAPGGRTSSSPHKH